ncbi:MAG TPA: aldehyde dehydrogenase family protein, partial [Novosphingobium sp.]|nr:aldehyde dehydrogenase family protein [Novosphingobium sp.]
MTMQAGFAHLQLPDMQLRSGEELLPETGRYGLEDPCTGAFFADCPVAGEAAVAAAVAAARRALADPAWRDLAPLARERLLHGLADAMEADLPRLAALEALDCGKPVAIAEAVDVPAAIAWLRAYAGWPGKLMGSAGQLAVTPGAHHVYSRR